MFCALACFAQAQEVTKAAATAGTEIRKQSDRHGHVHKSR